MRTAAEDLAGRRTKSVHVSFSGFFRGASVRGGVGVGPGFRVRRLLLSSWILDIKNHGHAPCSFSKATGINELLLVAAFIFLLIAIKWHFSEDRVWLSD
jgi:hypothetical protein